jgi:hypothetical protein
MGLIIFAGEQVDPLQYNDVLYRDGRGLLPAKPEQVREGEAVGLVVEQLADSPLAPLLKIASEAMARIRPKRILEVSLPSEKSDNVRVLARWNDAKQTPALLEKRIGQGRVLFWTISADRDWSDWPTEASFVLATRLAAQSVASRISRWENLTAGQPLRYPLDAETLPQTATLVRLGSEDHYEPIISRDGASGPELLLPQTRIAGHYEAAWEEAGGTPRSRRFAVSPDSRDSDPKRVERSEIGQYLGKLIPRMLTYSGEEISLASEGTELWRTLAIVMFGLLIFESLFAAWIGRVR